MFSVYLTFYLGDLLPPFYIGSTTVAKLERGYHGSATSARYGDIWYREIRDNPHLFVTFPIPGQTASTAVEILDLELAWQKEFDVVRDPRFVNQCYAKAGFCSTTETALKAAETRKKNGTHIRSEETKQKISRSKSGKPATPRGPEYRETMRNAMVGRKLSGEWKAKISKSNTGRKHSDVSKAKMRESHLGRQPTPESVAKRLATIKANGGYEHSYATRCKIGQANKGRKLPPQSDAARLKRSASLSGRKRSPDATRKMHETYARKRAEKEAGRSDLPASVM